MTKDGLTARLQVLGEQLNRDVTLTGSELVLRVGAELEEELDKPRRCRSGRISPENALTGHENEVVSARHKIVTDTADLVTVVALVAHCMLIPLRHADEAVAFVLPNATLVCSGVSLK